MDIHYRMRTHTHNPPHTLGGVKGQLIDESYLPPGVCQLWNRLRRYRKHEWMLISFEPVEGSQAQCHNVETIKENLQQNVAIYQYRTGFDPSLAPQWGVVHVMEVRCWKPHQLKMGLRCHCGKIPLPNLSPRFVRPKCTILIVHAIDESQKYHKIMVEFIPGMFRNVEQLGI